MGNMQAPAAASMSPADKASWVALINGLGISQIAGPKGDRGVKGDKGDSGFVGITGQWDGTSKFSIDGKSANDMLRIGETTQMDFQVDGLTDLVWDASAGTLTNGTYLAPFYPTGATDTSTTSGTAIGLAATLTRLTTSAANQTRTLAVGTVPGQMKSLFVQTVTNSGTIAVTVAGATPQTLTFDAVGQGVTMIWNGANWRVVGFSGATMPGLA